MPAAAALFLTRSLSLIILTEPSDSMKMPTWASVNACETIADGILFTEYYLVNSVYYYLVV